MGVVKQALVLLVVLWLSANIRRLLQPSLPVVVGGECHPDFRRVCDVYTRNIESGKDKGSAFALYHRGRKVVDVWGGYADIESQIPWRRDTMTQAFSTTKGVASIVVAKMVQNGHLDYKKPVYHYWPEFAQNQKENITVEMLLSHQAGLVVLDEPISVYDIKGNPGVVEGILARQGTVWPAGSQFGYHALTFGLYVDLLVQKADPMGRDMETIFQEEIGQPFGLDFYTRVPADQFYRVARLYPKTKLGFFMDAFSFPAYLRPIRDIVFYPQSLMALCMTPIKEYSMDFNLLNDPQLRDVTVTSLTGTGTARSVAKLYGILANGGEMEGRQLLNQDRIDMLKTALVTGRDKVMVSGIETSVGPGVNLLKNIKGGLTFGHSGHGGQVGRTDVESRLGVSYLSNHLSIHGMDDDPRFVDLEAAVYESLEEMAK